MDCPWREQHKSHLFTSILVYSMLAPGGQMPSM
jgi:hypothetical protein